MSISLAVQVYSIRDFAKEDLFSTLKKVKEMGYDGVEFAGLYENSPESIKKMCEEIGLTPISAHVGFNLMLENTEKVISDYKAIGVKYLAISSIAKEYRPMTENFDKVFDLFEKWGKMAKEHGIQLMYHNHDFEFVKINGKYALDIIYDKVSPEALTAEFDTCWIRSPGEDPEKYIRKYAGRVPVLHFKDLFGSKFEDPNREDGVFPKKAENHEYRQVGGGIVDIKGCLNAAKECGATWIVVEQDHPTSGFTSLESVALSCKYLRSLDLG